MTQNNLNRQQSFAIGVICLATTVFSYKGYSDMWPSFEGKLMAAVLAIATYFALYLFNQYVIAALSGNAPLKNRLAVLGMAAVFFVFIVGLSSSINVASISGNSAQVAHLRAFESDASAQKTRIYQRATAVQQFVFLLQQEQLRWQHAALDEKDNGVFSRSAGTGAVHSVLTGYADSFGAMAVQTDSFLAAIDALNKEADQSLSSIRQIIEQDVPPTERFMRASTHVDQLNTVLTKMQADNLVAGFVMTTESLNTALDAITLSSNTVIAQRQQEAIHKIRERLTGSTDLLIGKFEDYQSETQPALIGLTPITSLRAVMVYWKLFPQSWLAGLALDFLGLFLAVTMMVLRCGKKDAERLTEERMAMPVGDVINALLVADQLAERGVDTMTLKQLNDRHTGLVSHIEKGADHA